MNATTVTFTNPDVITRAQRNARALGLSLREYISRLVLRDTSPIAKYSRGSAGDKDPWGPVPQWLSEQWDKEVAEFEAEDKKQPRPRFTSGADYVAYIRRQP